MVDILDLLRIQNYVSIEEREWGEGELTDQLPIGWRIRKFQTLTQLIFLVKLLQAAISLAKSCVVKIEFIKNF